MKHRTSRREFLKQSSALALLGLGAGPALSWAGVPARKNCGVRSLKEPVAIAMWDFSWLMRHEPGHKIGSEFANWDKVLDELVERGYNAVRIDAFPNLVAAGADGKVTESYQLPPYDTKNRVIWGNPVPTTIEPRRALKEFIPRCVDRGILVGLSTWFVGPDRGITGLDGLVRVWDETLRFMKDNDLLHNIYYVDLLNEYPLFNGFNWLKSQMEGDIQSRSEKAKAEGVHEWKLKAGDYTSEASRRIYINFANDAIDRLQKNWPALDFLFSLTSNDAADWRVMAPTKIAAIDKHTWFLINPLLGNTDTGYWWTKGDPAATDAQLSKMQELLQKRWTPHKPQLIEWMDNEMGEVAALGRKYDKPYGNTEGWGILDWYDHPVLNWDISKEAAEICAKLGRKHGYRFNCTSNFTEPQFPSLWADVAWHKRMTDIIRGR
jgi:hypothetical protein